MSLLLSFAIGLVAGLRSMTAPAVVAWAAYLGWIHLEGSPLAFLGSRWAVALFSLCAIAEFIADQLPKTPARTTPGPLGARIVFGALTGAALAIAGAQSGWLGAFLGIAGAVVGASPAHRVHAEVAAPSARLFHGYSAPDQSALRPHAAVGVLGAHTAYRPVVR